MTNERKNQLIESLRELMSSVTVLPHELDKPGRLQESIDKLTAAADIAEELLAIGVDDDEIEERISPAFIFNCRAVVYGFAGRIEDAIADRTRVIEIMDSRIAAGLTVNQETMANILSILADQHMKVGSKAEAYTCIQRAIEIYENLKSKKASGILLAADAYSFAGKIAQENGFGFEAVDYSAKAVELFDTISDKEKPKYFDSYITYVYNTCAVLFEIGLYAESLSMAQHEYDILCKNAGADNEICKAYAELIEQCKSRLQ